MTYRSIKPGTTPNLRQFQDCNLTSTPFGDKNFTVSFSFGNVHWPVETREISYKIAIKIIQINAVVVRITNAQDLTLSYQESLRCIHVAEVVQKCSAFVKHFYTVFSTVRHKE